MTLFRCVGIAVVAAAAIVPTAAHDQARGTARGAAPLVAGSGTIYVSTYKGVICQAR